MQHLSKDAAGLLLVFYGKNGEEKNDLKIQLLLGAHEGTPAG